MKKSSTTYSKAHCRCVKCKSKSVRLRNSVAFEKGQLKIYVECLACFSCYEIILEAKAVKMLYSGTGIRVREKKKG